MSDQVINEVAVCAAVARHGFDWHYRPETESTNLDALQHHALHGREVVAFSEAQSAGRGRRGRQWLSPYARNIYCTIGLHKSMPANRQGLLSIVTGLALCRALEHCAGIELRLKWPNDLLVDGNKIGGILIESRPLDETGFFFAIGYGINLFMDSDELEAIGQPAASLAQSAARPIDRTDVLIACVDEVIRSIQAFDSADAAGLIAQFESYDAYHGELVEVITGGDRISGINRGISESGELRLETGQGIELHSAAEISLRGVS